MKRKLLAAFLAILPLSIHAIAREKTMELPLTENKALEKTTTYDVHLDLLNVNILYKITCNINNDRNPNAKLLFAPRLLASSAYGNVELNAQPLPNNSNFLRLGENILSFDVFIGQEDIENYNRVSLSNMTEASFQVDRCTAVDISAESDDLKKDPIANLNGGYFFAYNNTDYLVTIGVGDFFPTKYVIEPHDRRFVFVSTNNQNIHIDDIALNGPLSSNKDN